MNILEILKNPQTPNTDTSDGPLNNPPVPEGFPNERFPNYMACVEHCVYRIGTLWFYHHDEDTAHKMIRKLWDKVRSHPRIKHFRITEDPIIKKWADEIEIEVLKEKLPSTASYLFKFGLLLNGKKEKFHKETPPVIKTA